MIVDYSRIKDIAGDDEDLIKQLFEMYVDSFNKCIKSLESAVAEGGEKGDLDWHHANHELKGSSYNLGFAELGDFCREIEYLKGQKAQKLDVIEKLKSVLCDVMDVIAEMDG